MREILVRPLKTPSEFEGAEAVQLSAWGKSELAVTPKEIMIAIQDNGGLVLGAFHEGRVVGYALLLSAYRDGKVYMYSHQTGVLREYQSKGVGFLLKRKQREVCLRRGFDMVAWTFDPIIARNAHFNFGKLGVVCRNYIIDYYGQMRDAVNAGLPTDRFLCEWFLEKERLAKIRSYARSPLGDAHVVIEKRGEEPHPICRDWTVDTKATKALVDIPRDIVELKREDEASALRWRLATREVFRSYFKAGYSAVALLKKGDRLQYLLTKARLPSSAVAGSRTPR